MRATCQCDICQHITAKEEGELEYEDCPYCGSDGECNCEDDLNVSFSD